MSDHYVVEYESWPLDDPEEDALGRHTESGIYEASSEIEAINAVLYYIRGRKSRFELAQVNEVKGPFEDKTRAHMVRYDE